MKKQLLVSGLLFVFCFQGFAQTTHTITMDAASFIPPNITIDAGDQVIWNNTSSITHTSTSGENCTSNGVWDSGNIVSGGTYSRVFSAAGSYPYYCTYHCLQGMTGTIIVSEVTGIKNRTKPSSFNVNNIFPNPADNFVMVEYTSTQSAEVKIEIVSTVGIVVKTQYSQSGIGKNNLTVDVADLHTGMYYCIFSSNDERMTMPISVR